MRGVIRASILLAAPVDITTGLMLHNTVCSVCDSMWEACHDERGMGQSHHLDRTLRSAEKHCKDLCPLVHCGRLGQMKWPSVVSRVSLRRKTL